MVCDYIFIEVFFKYNKIGSFGQTIEQIPCFTYISNLKTKFFFKNSILTVKLKFKFGHDRYFIKCKKKFYLPFHCILVIIYFYPN